MVGVAQLVERRIVIPVVVGSSPITHPNRVPAATLAEYYLGILILNEGRIEILPFVCLVRMH
jgi:hypothetical protein